ncbi:DUF4192 family protein [Nocardia takedensis]|uniref:DUF4192 family protein n=1 Tax=Nocardia takedensis TaxID=259390 RepID=UPI003F76EF15
MDEIDNTADHPPSPIFLRGPGQTLAALPAMCGVTPPPDSVVVLLFDGMFLASARALVPADGPVDDALSQLSAVLTRQSISAAWIVVIAATQAAARTGLEYMEAVARTVSAHRVQITGQYFVPQLAAGARWTDLVTGAHGEMDAPETNILTAATLYEGHTIAADVDQIRRRYEQLAAEVAVPPGDAVVADVADTLRALAETIRGHRDPAPELAARTAFILTAPGAQVRFADVHSAVLGLGSLGATAAASVFARIGAQLRGNARALALTYAGAFAYRGGRITESRYALNEAARAARAAEVRMLALARIVNAAIHQGHPPQFVAPVIADGVRNAARWFGVEFASDESTHRTP